MGTPETVVKRACPCSSTFMPVGAPIGRSGAFSRVGASVFSAQFFSVSEERRFSKTSATGFSATCGLDCFFSIRTPVFCCDDREASATGQGGGRSENDRSVWTGQEIICRAWLATSRLVSRLLPRKFPRLGIFPRDVGSVVEVQ